jgi:cytochrome b561
MTATTRYTRVAIILHWLIALAIFFMIGLGWYMTELPKDGPKQIAFDLFDLGMYSWQMSEPGSPRMFYFNLHKSVGLTLFALILFRLYWRVTHTPPAMLSSYQAWERKLATGTHHFLYLLMVAIPLTGLLMSLNSKFGINWFGMHVFDGVDNKDVRDTFEELHELGANLIIALIVVHIVGALKHHFLDKDTTLSKMSLK